MSVTVTDQPRERSGRWAATPHRVPDNVDLAHRNRPNGESKWSGHYRPEVSEVEPSGEIGTLVEPEWGSYRPEPGKPVPVLRSGVSAPDRNVAPALTKNAA